MSSKMLLEIQISTGSALLEEQIEINRKTPPDTAVNKTQIGHEIISDNKQTVTGYEKIDKNQQLFTGYETISDNKKTITGYEIIEKDISIQTGYEIA